MIYFSRRWLNPATWNYGIILTDILCANKLLQGSGGLVQQFLRELHDKDVYMFEHRRYLPSSTFMSVLRLLLSLKPLGSGDSLHSISNLENPFLLTSPLSSYLISVLGSSSKICYIDLCVPRCSVSFILQTNYSFWLNYKYLAINKHYVW